ncbi:MAG: RNA methyltransferase [Cytophagales bacterium]|nr:RNA methyltransferase [Cytophagales bacterium]
MKLKKYRNKASCFLVEGAKNVIELIGSDYDIQELYLTEKFIEEHPEIEIRRFNYTICKERELISMGTFQSNAYALAVAKMKRHPLNLAGRSAIALDEVSDPGNLGTIIRIADWYGIRHVIAGIGTADFYNPKVINASMGSFSRVQIHHFDLAGFFEDNTSHKVYGAVLNGANIHHLEFEKPLIILMGNESNGINAALLKYVDFPITIPGIGAAESLNVAVSTAVICDNIFRN